MAFFDRFSNGWELGITSLKIIRDHPKLLLFPVMSTAAMLMVGITFLGGAGLLWGFNLHHLAANMVGEVLAYALLFVFYLITYFVIIFFNVGLVYASRRIFNGEEVTISEAINFSSSRLGAILQWSVLAATVGVLLNMLQERMGAIGKIIAGIAGIAWSLATYFVVPVIAFEDRAPIDALKRSGQMIREKWGESLAANFGFGLFFVVGYIAIIASSFLLGYLTHPLVGVVAGLLAILVLHTVVAAAKTVFLAAVYQHMNHEPHGDFRGETLDSVFIKK